MRGPIASKVPSKPAAPATSRKGEIDPAEKAAALGLLRRIVILRCPTPTVTAFLNYALDIIESLGN